MRLWPATATGGNRRTFIVVFPCLNRGAVRRRNDARLGVSCVTCPSASGRFRSCGGFRARLQNRMNRRRHDGAVACTRRDNEIVLIGACVAKRSRRIGDRRASVLRSGRRRVLHRSGRARRVKADGVAGSWDSCAGRGERIRRRRCRAFAIRPPNGGVSFVGAAGVPPPSRPAPCKGVSATERRRGGATARQRLRWPREVAEHLKSNLAVPERYRTRSERHRQA